MPSSPEDKRKHYAKKQMFLRAYKAERGCAHCGEKDAIVLQFHHPDPELKHPNLKQRSKGNTFTCLSWADLAAEVDKCVVLCANCHIREEFRLKGVSLDAH